ncbi:GGDEF domain-containing protein [Methylomarinum vadi]|uniref:GGDEF domain-containing protein n=1 Tax=Methylomarinum vadi TaxID=438855 RepID=UPI0004DF566A|nr:GGDEF domain-containing protein [Methylomarinum vadi]
MNLFQSNKNTSKWEKKYFSLLDEHDAQAKVYQENEALLCKTISRLALAATGFHKELDPYLARMRQQLKNGLNSDDLKRELENFSNALMTFDESSLEEEKYNPALLIEFLIRQYPNRQTELERLYHLYQDKRNVDLQDLLSALQAMMDEERSVVSEIHQPSLDDKAIRAQLMRLLESTEIPEAFVEQAEQLKIRLQNVSEDLPSILDTGFTLMLAMKKQYQLEQQAMAQFLSNLTEQLGDIGQHATGMAKTDDTQGERKNLLDQSFSSQINELRQASKQAEQLEPLQQLLSSRLDQIMEQLQAQQQQEQLEHNRQRLTLQQLALKIQRLETESRERTNKLTQARERAYHDALTGLPNRLAYDEKLTLELQRRQRRHSPLSLVIWDIDLFAKINESFGQKAGDNTLKIIARLLAQNCRGTDVLSRFGGDEFIMLLPDTDVQSAQSISEKLRRLIKTTGFNSSGKKIAITLSCGITEFDDKDTGDSAFSRARQALRQAKKLGRNRCIVG